MMNSLFQIGDPTTIVMRQELQQLDENSQATELHPAFSMLSPVL